MATREGRTRFMVTMDNDLHERAKKEASRLGVTLTGLISVCLSEKLKNDEAVDALKIIDMLAELAKKNGKQE